VFAASALAQYDPVILFEVEGDTLNQQLGHHALVPVGDVDGDGYDDILANAATDGHVAGYSTESRIYYGSDDGTERYVSFARIDSLPRSQVLAYKGRFDDMNGDGHLDIFASFYQDYSPNYPYMRALYHGGPGFDTIPDWVSPWQVYGGGDIVGDYDGDGHADYVTIKLNTGRFWFHRGGPEPDSLPSWSFSRSASDYGIYNGRFGDVNGDGYDDFLRYSGSASSPDSNAVDIFLGGPQADSLPDVTYKYSWYEGYAWTIVPDLNGDGYDDIWGRKGSLLADCTYIYFGGDPVDFGRDLRLSPTSGRPAYEWISGVGDINGDGYNDLAMSGHLSGSGQWGEVAIYLGGRWMDGQADIHLRGEPGGPYVYSGYRTVSAGDFNGDGIMDWAYSSRGLGEENGNGRITVVSGDTSLHVSSPPGRGSLVPESMRLLPPYPNPFNPEIIIPIEVSKGVIDVQLQVVNTLGQRVYVFPSERLAAGSHRLKWDGRTQSGRLAASGRYFVRLLGSEGVQVQPIVLQR